MLSLKLCTPNVSDNAIREIHNKNRFVKEGIIFTHDLVTNTIM